MIKDDRKNAPRQGAKPLAPPQLGSSENCVTASSSEDKASMGSVGVASNGTTVGAGSVTWYHCKRVARGSPVHDNDAG